jgi:hypothetical protein
MCKMEWQEKVLGLSRREHASMLCPNAFWAGQGDTIRVSEMNEMDMMPGSKKKTVVC